MPTATTTTMTMTMTMTVETEATVGPLARAPAIAAPFLRRTPPPQRGGPGARRCCRAAGAWTAGAGSAGRRGWRGRGGLEEQRGRR